VLGLATVDLLTGGRHPDGVADLRAGRPRWPHECRHLQSGRRHGTCRALGMLCDRYTVLTNRTPREHPLVIGWGAAPCDLAMLAEQTTVAQAIIMAEFEKHRSNPGNGELVEPGLPPVPQPLAQAVLEAETTERLTLAVANQVMRTWTAWLTTERERVKRWAYMPGGHKGEAPALLPAEFMKRNIIQPITSLPR
jgi:hypothetical protein